MHVCDRKLTWAIVQDGPCLTRHVTVEFGPYLTRQVIVQYGPYY